MENKWKVYSENPKNELSLCTLIILLVMVLVVRFLFLSSEIFHKPPGYLRLRNADAVALCTRFALCCIKSMSNYG